MSMRNAAQPEFKLTSFPPFVTRPQQFFIYSSLLLLLTTQHTIMYRSMRKNQNRLNSSEVDDHLVKYFNGQPERLSRVLR